MDILRAVAVLLVILRHFEQPDYNWSLFNAFVQGAAWIGWAGVDLFFALSGFLISNLLFTELRVRGEVSVGRFLARRAFKIYPGFYLLIFLNALEIVPPQGVVTARSIAGEVFFLQGYLDALWLHTWSLAVEEHFYFLMAPVFFFARPAWLVRFWPWSIMAVVGGCLAARLWNARSHPFDYATDFFPTHTRIDGLFLGSLVGYLYNFRREQCEAILARQRPAFFFAMAICLILPFIFELEKSRFAQTFGLLFLSCGCSMAVTATLFAKRAVSQTNFCARKLGEIGRCSYAIYLWHMPVWYWILPELETYRTFQIPAWIRLCAYVGLSLAFGMALTRWVEEPCLRLRERLFPRRTLNPQARPGT